MFRTLTASVLATLMISSASVVSAAADEGPSGSVVAPNAIVAKAWAKEAGGSSNLFKTMAVTYGVVQGLDMASTMKARNRGAMDEDAPPADSHRYPPALRRVIRRPIGLHPPSR
jgi:hypothetical protein